MFKFNNKDIPECVQSYNQDTRTTSVLHFYTPWKRQKTAGFLMFLGGIEMKYWLSRGVFISNFERIQQTFCISL